MNSWSQQYLDGTSARKFPDEELIRFISRAHLPPETKALELGCGNGRNAQAIMRAGLEYYGVDGSKEAIAIAQNEYFGGIYTCGFIPPIAYGDGMFHAVVDVQFMQHLNMIALAETLTEIKRVLVPRGLFFSVYMAAVDPGIYPNEPELLDCQSRDYGLIVHRAGFEVTRAERVTRTFESGTKQATWIILDSRKI